jgi:hypothetical protein
MSGMLTCGISPPEPTPAASARRPLLPRIVRQVRHDEVVSATGCCINEQLGQRAENKLDLADGCGSTSGGRERLGAVTQGRQRSTPSGRGLTRTIGLKGVTSGWEL